MITEDFGYIINNSSKKKCMFSAENLICKLHTFSTFRDILKQNVCCICEPKYLSKFAQKRLLRFRKSLMSQPLLIIYTFQEVCTFLLTQTKFSSTNFFLVQHVPKTKFCLSKKLQFLKVIYISKFHSSLAYFTFHPACKTLKFIYIFPDQCANLHVKLVNRVRNNSFYNAFLKCADSGANFFSVSYCLLCKCSTDERRCVPLVDLFPSAFRESRLPPSDRRPPDDRQPSRRIVLLCVSGALCVSGERKTYAYAEFNREKIQKFNYHLLFKYIDISKT